VSKAISLAPHQKSECRRCIRYRQPLQHGGRAGCIFSQPSLSLPTAPGVDKFANKRQRCARQNTFRLAAAALLQSHGGDIFRLEGAPKVIYKDSATAVSHHGRHLFRISACQVILCGIYKMLSKIKLDCCDRYAVWNYVNSNM
jgi:hypothetical protein